MYLVYVVDPSKINVVRFDIRTKEVQERELLLPVGVRVKCPVLLDNEQNNRNLAQNLAKDCSSKGFQISEDDIKDNIPP